LDAVHRRGGVGIALDEAWRGRSLAGKALDLLIDYAFNLLNLHQLYCSIETGNESSLALFKSRNFQVAGLKKEWRFVEGDWKDEYLLQLIHNE
jgi:diamine N-acetyltransferase